MLFRGRKWTYLLTMLLAFSCVGVVDDEPADEYTGPDGPVTEDAAPGIVFDFTATWCVNCPRMHEAIEAAKQERPGLVFPVSIHFRDDFSTDETEALCNQYKVQAYPSAVVNLDPNSLMTATSKDLLIARLDETAKGRKQPCTIVATADLEGTILTLSLEVTAAEAGEYAIGALLLEDGLVAAQTGGRTDYVHDAVLRKIISASVSGDNLGSLTAGASAQKSYTLDVPSSSHYRLLLYTLSSGQLNAVTSIEVR